MAVKQSTAKGFTILGAASILNKALSIIYVPILTLLIGDVGNGIANAGYVVYLLVFQITYMGIPVAISKMVSEQIALGRYCDSIRTFRIAGVMLLGLGTVLSLATALGAGAIARMVGRPESAMTLLALSPTVLIASFSAAFRGYFQGRHNMTPTSVSQIVEQAANTVFTLVFAWWMLKIGRQHAAMHGITDPALVNLYSWQWGAAGSGLGTTAGALFSAVYLVFVYFKKRKEFRTETIEEENNNPGRTNTLARELARRILRYAAPIILGVVMVYSANLVDLKFTNQRLEAAGFSSIQATGLYGILTTQYNKIIGVPLALANTLAVVMLPGISGMAALDNREKLHAKIDSGLRAVFLLTLPSAVILAVLAEPVIRLLFPHNVSGMDLMRMGSWVITLTALVQLQTSILQGMGRMQLPTINMAIALLLKIVVNYTLIGIPSVNIKGAVVGSMLCYGLAALLNYLRIRKIAGYHAHWRRLIVPPLLASAVMAAVVWGLWTGLNMLLKPVLPFISWRNLITTLVALLAGAAVYAAGLVAFKGVNRFEIMSMPLLPRLVGMNKLRRMLDKLKVK